MEENIKYDGTTEWCSRNHGAVQQGGGSFTFQPSGNAMRQQILRKTSYLSSTFLSAIVQV